jgi:hypothetical protein
MVMSTTWSGFSCGVENTLAEGMMVLTSYTCVITLSDTPGIVRVVNLPENTRQIRVWTGVESLRLALDTTPLPVGTSGANPVPASTFQLGATVLPGVWHTFTIPDDTLLHTVHIMSTGVSPVVTLVAMVE